MIRRPLMVAAVIALILSAGPRFAGAQTTRATVAGPSPDADPGAADLFETVGMIACEQRLGDNRSVRGWGTAAVVGSRDTILTVAHIFVKEPRGERPPVEFAVESDCEFRLFGADGQLVFETGFEHATFGAFLNDRGLPNQDWAVLRTRERLPDSVDPLPFTSTGSEVLNARARLPIEVLAFHADRRRGPRVPLLSRGTLFEVQYAGYPRLAHTADTDRMSSGAPVVHRTASGLSVVLGIHRSQAEYGDFKLTVPLSHELVQTLQAYAHGQTPARRQRVADRSDGPRTERTFALSAGLTPSPGWTLRTR